jgi:hypothetical protein
VGFSSLAAAADTADCILTLNRMFSSFDALIDKLGVHKAGPMARGTAGLHASLVALA